MSRVPFNISRASCCSLFVCLIVIVLGLVELTREQVQQMETHGLPASQHAAGAKCPTRAEVRRIGQYAHIPPGCPDYLHEQLKGTLVVNNRYKHAASADQAQRGYILAGHDLTGWNGLSYPSLKNNKKALGEKCFRACVQTNKCEGYTYHPVEGKCFLKSSIDGIGGNLCGSSNTCWFWGRSPALYR
mmetsp:Transcript_29949/g.58532  ORF Transcript_29949/g.58532 Transcript_29949/m.58532 type:complete len:187 (-) Transcript_29949:258-818(-)